MALKKSSGLSDLRIYEPSFACEYSSRKEEAEHRSRLLAKIHNAYSKALERLAGHNKARRPVAMRIRGGGGFCFGLLDPTSNIIANTFIPCPRDPAAEKGRGDEAAACGVEKELKELERRSLDGMVTFLTRFFPYLADCEAVRYLLLADADLLVATRIIVVDRRMKRFGSSEPAVEEALRMALRCAALAAQHSDPDRFVGAWLTISSRLDEAISLLAKEQTYELHAICSVNDQVSGPVYCPESDACPPEKFCRSHVNFLATPRYIPTHDNEVPVLFFAEFSNDDEDKAEAQPLCCPVCIPPPCSERVRCLYCDYVGIRIIHPIGKNFHGREEDFESMVCKKDPFDEYFESALMPQYYTNTAIISHSSSMAERIGRLEEDRLYESNEDDSDSDYTSEEC